MNKDTIRIPIVAHMTKQPDGSFKIVPEDSIYADVSADAVARFIMEGLHVSFKEAVN